MTDSSRSELGDFLRSRREKLTPQAAGLPDGRRRRTPGLRREEVAELAGIGVDWYVRLEQGRAVSPSATTVDALAQALLLNRAEHAHLRALARNPTRRAFMREQVPETIGRLITSLPEPAYVTGRRWDVLAWNAAANELFGFKRVAEPDRNILIFMLLMPEARRLFGATWATEARRMVAQFRTTSDLWAGDAAFLGLILCLRRGSPEFADWWEAHDVRGIAAGQKQLHHPSQGRLCYEYATFQANDDPALKLTIYSLVERIANSPAR